jgi:predicted amino acid racemase
LSTPRIEVDLDLIGQNAQTLVRQLGARGVSVTGVTKAMCGLPALGRTLLAAGAVALGESRVENVERLRAAGIEAPIVLIRSPLPSQIERVVASADVSCNSDFEVIERLSAAAGAVGRTHGVVLMVELGDLREGMMPSDVPGVVGLCLALRSIRLHGLGTNLACRHGVVPDDRNMAELSALTESIEAQFGIELDVVSGGNSANLDWARDTNDVGRVNNLRLGESILLGCQPLRGTAITGLHCDAATVVAEVIESKCKPRRAWGERARTPFPPLDACDRDGDDCGWQSILAIGHQDTDPAGLSGPPGTRVLGASSDHLVVGSDCRLAVGSEVRFRPSYSALVRAMTSPFVAQAFVAN